MIRAIIFAVFVVPIISLVLDKTQKATEKAAAEAAEKEAAAN